jgi:hypothetical protein
MAHPHHRSPLSNEDALGLVFPHLFDRLNRWSKKAIKTYFGDDLNDDDDLDDDGERAGRYGLWEAIHPNVLRLRLVSKGLCEAIDSFLITEYEKMGRKHYKHLTCPYYSYYFFGDFIKKFKDNSETNPFIIRQVEFFVGTPSEKRDVEQLVEFAELFGRHARSCVLSAETLSVYTRKRKILQRILSHLPYLRRLEIYSQGGKEVIVNARQQYPDLPYLSEFCVSRFPKVAERSLLAAYAPQLQIVRQCHISLLEGCANLFCKLTYLEIRVPNNANTASLQQLNSPLKTLCITIKPEGDGVRSYDIQPLLRDIQHLDRLNELTVEFSCYLGETTAIDPNLSLPSIRTLRLIRHDCEYTGMCLNFIACLPNLEYVGVKVEALFQWGKPLWYGAVDKLRINMPLHGDTYNSPWNSMYDSKIWSALPLLQKFVYKRWGWNDYRCTTYRRHVWEKRCAKKSA